MNRLALAFLLLAAASGRAQVRQIDPQIDRYFRLARAEFSGERAKETVAFMSVAGRPLSLTCKLPLTRLEVLKLPFAKPTGYGLGKSGWVTMNFDPETKPPLDLLKRCMLESYRAVAPKKLVAQLEAEQPWTRTGQVG